MGPNHNSNFETVAAGMGRLTFHCRAVGDPTPSHLSEPWRSAVSLPPTWPVNSHISDDPYRLSHALQACGDARDLRHGSAVHAHLLKFQASLGRSFSLWNKLLNLYCRFAPGRYARRLFDRMPVKDAVSFNTLLSVLYGRSCDPAEPVCLYSRMLRDNIKPSNVTLSALLNSVDNVKTPTLLEQIHPHAVKFGLCADGFVGSAIVSGYAECRGFEESVRGFEEIAEPDLVAWNVMIDVCARYGNRWHAVEIFSRMHQEGEFRFDCFTLTSVLKTCLVKEDLSLGKQLHGCSLKAGFDWETPFGNALITMYSRCEERMSSAVEAFRGVVEPNIITWTAMIAGLSQNGLAEEAMSFYKEMNMVGMIENEFCFASLLSTIGILANLEHGRIAHCRIIRSEFRSDVEVGNALVAMYFKCGSLEDARLAFDTMRDRDVVSWMVMISGLGQHGNGREAVEIFRSMRSKGFKPDGVMFLAGLSACNHGGLVDEGLSIFRSMVDEYGIKPKREHCACLVDTLGRAGRLKEAGRLIEEMGMGLDPVVWEALLGACRIHGEKELGEKSAEKIMELDPRKDGPYVLLSNIYAEQSMWEEKVKLRKRLDESGLRKEAAGSWFSGLEI